MNPAVDDLMMGDGAGTIKQTQTSIHMVEVFISIIFRKLDFKILRAYFNLQFREFWGVFADLERYTLDWLLEWKIP